MRKGVRAWVGALCILGIWSVAAGLERGSEHPLASAIVQGAEARGLRPPEARDFQSVTGKGVVGEVEGRKVVLGNAALLAEHGVDASALRPRLEN